MFDKPGQVIKKFVPTQPAPTQPSLPKPKIIGYGNQQPNQTNLQANQQGGRCPTCGKPW